MLLQFCVENHRSLRDEQCLSLTASSPVEGSDVKLHRLPTVEEPVIPAAAIYGANASGKTNVLHALTFMRAAVLDSHRIWVPESGTPQQPFALDERSGEPSQFEVDAWAEGVRYRYGFVLNRDRVEEEWLYAWPEGREETWFERTGDNFEFGHSFQGDNEAIRGFTRPNSLFLSAAAQNNHAATRPLFSWFRRLSSVMRRGRETFGPLDTRSPILTEMFSGQLSLFPEDNDAIRKDRASLVRLLNAADTGIVDIKINHNPMTSGGSPFNRRPPELLFKHRAAGGREVWLPLEQQSAGTITLLSMGLSLISCLRGGGVLCVDELEASLHPILALELLKLFHDEQENPSHAQMIFTTHDTNLLGNLLGDPPLRRDQIWFTEKDDSGATHLYPLTDFHSGGEENFERGYLQGRYGAIPFIGKLVPLVKEG